VASRPKISYRTGYCRPPRHSQFRPGTSGNPKGRPKGSLNLATVLERTLKEKVTVTEKGRRSVITKLDAAVKQLVNKAASGEERATRFLLDLVQLVEDRFAPAIAATAKDLPETDQAVARRILSRLQKLTRDTPG
jgi:hypothetical protein